MHVRKMGVDYGEKRIGIAVSDPLGFTARGILTIYWNGTDIDRPVERIGELCAEYEVDTVVVGLPRRTDGKPSLTAEKAIMFAEKIKTRVKASVIMRDERYTSVLAGRILREKGKGRDRKSGEADMMAAEILLSDYLRSIKDANNNGFDQ